MKKLNFSENCRYIPVSDAERLKLFNAWQSGPSTLCAVCGLYVPHFICRKRLSFARNANLILAEEGEALMYVRDLGRS